MSKYLVALAYKEVGRPTIGPTFMTAVTTTSKAYRAYCLYRLSFISTQLFVFCKSYNRTAAENDKMVNTVNVHFNYKCDISEVETFHLIGELGVNFKLRYDVTVHARE
jgi:hypothetical protein